MIEEGEAAVVLAICAGEPSGKGCFIIGSVHFFKKVCGFCGPKGVINFEDGVSACSWVMALLRCFRQALPWFMDLQRALAGEFLSVGCPFGLCPGWALGQRVLLRRASYTTDDGKKRRV